MTFSQIEPLEARIAPATLSIAPASVIEGNTGKTALTFTVTLSEAETNPVTVSFATANGTGNGTAVSSGLFPDYDAQSGTLNFAVGETSKTISVQVVGDPFQEADETLQVTLSNATVATIATATATGTIQDDGDTAVGIAMADVRKVEGATNSTVTFTPTLSGTLATAVTFTVSTQSGTAAAGADFTAETKTVTIPAGQTSTTFTIAVRGDAVFETAESFYVNLSGLPNTVTPVNQNVVNPTAQVSARVYVLDDDIGAIGTNQLRWTDIDGDLVSLAVSRGSFFNAFGQLDTSVVNLVPKGTVGGSELLVLNLNSSAFFGTNVTVTATPQLGFPDASNGRVDVGFIQAARFIPSELLAIGVDLGVVTIDGDLAKIAAGDQFSTTAIRKLDVYSLGVNATTLTDLVTDFRNTQSDVLGPIGTVQVKTNVAGFLHVIGAQFGTIGTLTVEGALKGGTEANSGRVMVSGKITKATFGSIEGGAGAGSGLLVTSALDGRASFGSVTVKGSVLGGAGDSSGGIVAQRIGNVTIDGNVTGSTGANSGSVSATTSLGLVKVGGDVRGGSVANSGEIRAGTTLAGVTIGGKLTGGAGEESGIVVAGTRLGKVTVTGDVMGGGGKNSGAIISNGTSGSTSVAVGGKVLGGNGESSGGIRTAGDFSAVTIGGSLGGGAGAASGQIQAIGNVGAISIGKDTPGATAGNSISGGAGANSGQLNLGNNLTALTTAGTIQGGTGNGSGGISAVGAIGTIAITGNLRGGDSTASAFLNLTGFISAGSLTTLKITGDIASGIDGGGGLASSGSIRAGMIGTLEVGGDVRGNRGANDAGILVPVIISAAGSADALAFQSVKIGGDVRFAEILAGYNEAGTAAQDTAGKIPRGTAVNGDASIGTIEIGGDVRALNIVAGALANSADRFGATGSTTIPQAAGSTNSAARVAQIGSVIIRGTVEADPDSYGIVAQAIGLVRYGTPSVLVPLAPGAGNDLAGKPIDDASKNFTAIELPVP